MDHNKAKGIGIASLVCGILSIVLSCTVVISIACAIAGMTLAVIYLVRRKQERGIAIAGLVTSGVGMLFSLIFIAFVFVAAVKDVARDVRQLIPFYEEMPQEEPDYDDFYHDFFEDYFGDDYDQNYRDYNGGDFF